MEERILDDEDARLIKIKRTKNGTDAVEEAADAEAEDGAAEAGEFVPEYSVEFPEGDDYDEDLVGLTPSQLKEELERRERVKRESEEACEKFCAEGEEKLAAGDFDGAAESFEQAVNYVRTSERAHGGLWTARTKNFTDDAAYYDEDNAEEFCEAPESVREKILSRDGEKLRSARAELEEKIVPMQRSVESKQEERREPLRNHLKYYTVRLLSVLGSLAVAVIGIILGAYYSVRTTSIAPVVLIGIFGVGAAVCLFFTGFFTRKRLVASRLCRLNEQTGATEEGKELLNLQSRVRCINLILNEEQD